MKKKIIFSVCGISIIIALFLISYFMNKTYYNDPSVLGNSSGNLFNGGLFCESDGKIYFSNPNDEGRIYSMDEDFTNFKKLSSDTGNYLNVAGKYIVYVDTMNCRVKHQKMYLPFPRPECTEWIQTEKK
jgi:hypothetical protein